VGLCGPGGFGGVALERPRTGYADYLIQK
jgi:hypothetical protein